MQARGVFRLAVSAQIIDLGMVIMHANVCRSDRISSKFVIVKGLDGALKRLCLGRRGSSENGGGRAAPVMSFINIEIELPIARGGAL